MPSFLTDLFGKRPDLPNAPIVNLPTSQQNAINANQASLPGSEQLVSKANQFSASEITQMLQSIIPGYSSMVSSATGNINSELQGQIPGDVSAAVQDSAAAKALGGGFGGSGAHGNLVARDLGLTSLDLTNQGLNSFEKWTQQQDSMYQPSQMSVGSMFITPGQEYQAEETNATNQFQQSWMKDQIAAMPDPTTVGLWNMGTGIVGSLLGAKVGSPSGGISGGMGGSGDPGGELMAGAASGGGGGGL